MAAVLVPVFGCGVEDADLTASGIAADEEALAEDDMSWYQPASTGSPDIKWARKSFERRNCETLTMGVDSDAWSTCPRNKFAVGIAMGSGHTSRDNLPHKLRCCELYSPKYGWVTKSLRVKQDYTYETKVDNNEMIYCPSGNGKFGRISSQMMSGMAGGWGHSSRYNVPHKFSCDGLGQIGKWYVFAGQISKFYPRPNTYEMFYCPSGGGMVGISGGWGHHINNEMSHEIACAEDLLLARSARD